LWHTVTRQKKQMRATPRRRAGRWQDEATATASAREEHMAERERERHETREDERLTSTVSERVARGCAERRRGRREERGAKNEELARRCWARVEWDSRHQRHRTRQKRRVKAPRRDVSVVASRRAAVGTTR
jgi:hypothetical protein